jgi:hypothetical protein
VNDNHIRTDAVNFTDWVLGRGEFSEESLAKARNEFFTKMGKHWSELMLASMEKAFSDLDAVPEAIANAESVAPQPTAGDRSGNPTSHSGTGNTQKPVAWARFFPNGGPMSVFLDRPPADSEPLYRHPLCQDLLQKNLTEAEHDALEFAVETGRVAIDDDAILRKLLERLNHDAEPAPKCGGEAGLSSREGTGNTPSKAEIDALEFVVEEGRIGNYGILRSWLIRLRPEWESQSYEESDEKRVNTNTNRDTTRGEGSVQNGCRLTDEEREAVEWYANFPDGIHADTLRKLLERLK